MIDEHLQNDLILCKSIAAEEYGIPAESWVDISDNANEVHDIINSIKE